VALVAALMAIACALALPAVAAAEEFTVDSTADETDSSSVDGLCQTAALKCTLRAAIEQANSSAGEFDSLFFDEDLFDGGSAGTIDLTKSLPTITDPLLIKGQCADAAEVLRPCVGIDGPGPTEPAVVVSNTDEAEIEGVAVTGAETGIRVEGSERVKVLGSWLGVKLDGSLAGNGTGVLLNLESSNSRVGSEGSEGRNVFAGNSGDGLDIVGTSNVRVLGNYFGVGPDGTTPAPNGGEGIEVASKSTGSSLVEASGITIGTQLSSARAASPACDGGCNVISGAGSSGIDLEGDPADEELAAASTTIFGNYIGLDASGTRAVPNGGDGVHVGEAVRTVIGGPRSSEANRLAGGEAAVVAGPAADNLVVRGNLVGVDVNGGSLVAPDAGIVVDSEGLSGPTAEAVVAGNELRMEGGVAISQTGLAGWISGNRISGADSGIRVDGAGEEGLGNLIQDNAIAGSSGSGILVESSFNELLGNEIRGSGVNGIRVEGAGLFSGFGVGGNRIGGDREGDENLISGSGGAAIEISNPEKATNEVARNRGFANGGLFIDLVAASPSTEPKGPNKGIKPPVFAFASQLAAAGSGAQPDATIRVFRKASAEVGEIESFLGEAIADEDGNWEVLYGSSVPPGTRVAATQTGAGSGTSELALASVPSEAGGASGVPKCAVVDGCASPPRIGCSFSFGCGASPNPRPPTPRTKIMKGKFHGTTAKFKFSSSVKGSTFQCKLDRAPFKRCGSPKTYRRLKPGKHLFEVRAVNSVGRADPTPAQQKFTVLG
jgi:CSLREA domain-containing protein